MIAIIDYGMGNLRSVWKAFESVGQHAVVTRDPATIRSAGHVVLPGVGAFGDCMANLQRFDLVEPIRSTVQSGKPFLGICLGLQLLFTESQEFGVHKGLNIIPGQVKRFGQEPALKIPHIGWNQVNVERACPLFADIADGSNWYFVHSYFVEPLDRTVAATTTTYGAPFVSAIWKDNIVGCQFHPEKSQSVGLRLMKNFGAWRA
jgi:glutamine amidotransferase